MKLTYDKGADAAYLYVKYPLKSGETKKTVEVSEQILVDLDSHGKLLGVEILHASKVLSRKALLQAQHR